MEYLNLFETVAVALSWGIGGFLIGRERGLRSMRDSAQTSPRKPFYSKGKHYFVLTSDEWFYMMLLNMASTKEKAPGLSANIH